MTFVTFTDSVIEWEVGDIVTTTWKPYGTVEAVITNCLSQDRACIMTMDGKVKVKSVKDFEIVWNIRALEKSEPEEIEERINNLFHQLKTNEFEEHTDKDYALTQLANTICEHGEKSHELHRDAKGIEVPAQLPAGTQTFQSRKFHLPFYYVTFAILKNTFANFTYIVII